MNTVVKKRYLTKSRFKLALECPTKLYYAVKEIDDLPKNSWCLFSDSDFKESIIQLKEYLTEYELTKYIYTVEYCNYTENWDVYGGFN